MKFKEFLKEKENENYIKKVAGKGGNGSMITVTMKKQGKGVLEYKNNTFTKEELKDSEKNMLPSEIKEYINSFSFGNKASSIKVRKNPTNKSFTFSFSLVKK